MTTSNEQEIEVKFFIRDLDEIRRRLEALNAVLTAPRVMEINLRFDLPNNTLTRRSRVLRLRQDVNAVMTFKGPSQAGDEVSTRQEIEFEVSDFTAARHLLEALGYQVKIIYEKYRTTYDLNGLTIVLDEMPFGHFIEIEGPDADAIRDAAAKLQLDWSARCTTSYLALFNQLRSARKLTAHNLTFAEVAGITAAPEDLGLRYGDQ